MNKKVLITAGIILVVLALIISFSLKKGKPSFSEDKAAALSAQSLLSQARGLQAKGDLSGVKTIYQKLVNDFPNSGDVMSWQKKIDDVNIRPLFSPAITAKSVLYEIKPGDTLNKIARQFKTTTELIKKSNHLASDVITPGKKIKVWNTAFSILVDKSQNILLLKSDEEIIKTYVVATGKDNSTPVGTFKITSKLVNPTWFKTGVVIPAGSP